MLGAHEGLDHARAKSLTVARIKIEGLGLIGAPSSIPRPDYGRDAAAKRARDAAYARAARGTGGTFGVAYEQ